MLNKMVGQEYKIEDIIVEFYDIKFLFPLQIKNEEIRDITFTEVGIKLSKNSRTEEGKAGVFLSDIWAMEDYHLPHQKRDFLMRTIANVKRGMLINKEYISNPLDSHLSSYDEILRIGKSLGLPQLAVNNAISPIDLALWDAFARLNDKNIYACLDNKETGISHVTSSSHFHEPNKSVRVLHTLGGKDKIEKKELDTEEKKAGKMSLEEYIEQQGITAVKIKISGNVDEDVKKVKKTSELLCLYFKDNFAITVDPNEKYIGVDRLSIFLDRLRREDEFAFSQLLYVEQPTSRNVNASNQDVSYLVKEFGKPMVMDEMVSDNKTMKKAIELGWNGIALKPTAKIFSETLLELAIARENGLYICVQDLTNPGIALFYHLEFARRVVLENEPVETNARQYLSKETQEKLMRDKRLVSLYNIKNGRIDVSVLDEMRSKPQ